jgi:hypothetical protein
MPEHISTATLTRVARSNLTRYTAELSLESLAVGVDNIHHDVFLSPKFVESTRTFLYDVIRQMVNFAPFPGFERKHARAPELAAFRKMLGELLQSSLTRAKYEKNIERDLLLRVGLLRFFTQEIVTQFADLLLEAKEGIRNRGAFFERSEQAHVLKSRLAEIQSGRREVFRQIGQQLHQILTDLEESSLAKARKALFGDECADSYEMLKNRLVFVEGGRDDRLFLDQYVLLGNYVRDPDRFEVFDRMLVDLLRDRILPREQTAKPAGEVFEAHEALVTSALRMREELARLELEREDLLHRLDRSEDLLARVLRRDDPAELRAALTDLDRRRAFLQQKIDALTPQLEAARQKSGFLSEQMRADLDDYLNEPENARRLFAADGADPSDARAQLLEEWIERLAQHEVLYHVLASYEIRNLHLDYCPPVHLQQLRKALVVREELKRVEDILNQFPARQFSIKRLDEASKRLRRYTQPEVRTMALRFCEDLMRLRRDLRDYQKLTSAMERVNLVRAERTRELSQINRTLYEYLLPEEDRPAEDHVVSHVVIKADIRGSTKLTQDLLTRGLNPASHMSLNLYEPVQRVLDRYGASKVFVEGDAIIMAIYETQANRTRQRSVAKACLLARQILGIAQAYNERAAGGELPPLELGVGIAFQNSPPTYWMDKDSRIMISRAINLSDRLSSCSKAARRLLGQHRSPFRLFLFQTAIEGTTEEELDEFLLRYNLNGVELNEEGFLKLSEEISLSASEASGIFPWGCERVTFYSGLVPVGDTLEPLLIRKGYVRQLLPDGKIGAAGSRAYYEICPESVLPDSAGANGRNEPRKS